MSDSPKPAKVAQQAFRAAVLLICVAAGARLTWWLIEPLMPFLLIVVTLGIVFALAFGKFRR